MSTPTPTNVPTPPPNTPTSPTKSANNCKSSATSTSSNSSPPAPTACLELVPLASPLPPGVRSPHHARHRETRPRGKRGGKRDELKTGGRSRGRGIRGGRGRGG